MGSLVKLVRGNMLFKNGFTLIELVVVTGIFVLLASLGTLSFFSSYSNTNLNATKDVLIADLKTAQSNAMAGMVYPGATVSGWGLKILDSDSYVVFPGPTYDPSNTHNSPTDLPLGITISSTWPSNTLLFNQISGEINGYAQGLDTITLTANSGTRSIQLNQYGTIIGE